VDGYVWSKAGQLAGLRLKAVIKGKTILLEGEDPQFSYSGDTLTHIHWPLKTVRGTIDIELTETQMVWRLTGSSDIKWFLDLNTADSAKLPFDKITGNAVDCSFEGMHYKVLAEKGTFSQPANGAVWSICPQSNTIVLDFNKQ
jgi:hypothetical protein